MSSPDSKSSAAPPTPSKMVPIDISSKQLSESPTSTTPDSTAADSADAKESLDLPKFPTLPAAPAPRVFGQGWSASHKVPTVAQWQGIKDKHEQEAEEYARIMEAREEAMAKASAQSSDDHSPASANSRASTVDATHDVQKPPSADRKEAASQPQASVAETEKQRLMEQMNSSKEKPTERFKKRKGERRVRDPITGSEMIVKDVDKKDFDSTRPRTLGSNILYQTYPPPIPESFHGITQRVNYVKVAMAGSLVVLWFFSLGGGFIKFILRTMLYATVGFGLYSLLDLLQRNIEKEMNASRLDFNRSRGEAFSPPFPESVEWLNGLIKLVWGLIDPVTFISVADMIEDILQQSLPSFVDAVRITDIGQGINPLRITSIRALPDQPLEPGYPRTDWIDEGEGVPLKDTAGKELEEDQAGDYYNFEAAFSYSALPGQGTSLRAKNIHMLVEFFLGAYDWFHIPLPIWIQVEEIYGVVRLRIQFIPEPPFVRNVTFALCGVPEVEVSAIPMSRHLPNILDLPFISGFVKSGIAAGTAELSVPKSMTINLKDMLSGAQVGDTRAIGIFVVTIHYCVGLSAQDSNGKSDPYIVLAYAKYGRPLYSTRIIIEDLNPVYEETAFLLLTIDEIKEKEELCAMLWDSDKLSADDLVGRVQVPVEELIQTPNQMYRREDGLKGFEDANEMPGKLVWSIGYFEKAALLKSLERDPTLEEARHATTEPSGPSREMRPDDAAPNPARADLPPPPPDLTKTRPDPQFPSGILSIVLHQVNNLERQHLEGKSGDDREGEAGQDTDDPSQQTTNLPSGYGEFIVNDDLVYRTRVKQYTTNPYFEAGTEIFIRDFTTADVRVVIRDSRLRQADPILGIVSVQLSELFVDASTVTRTFPLREGQGFGKANISFAFRGVQTAMPAHMRGWETGTLIVSNVRLKPDPNSKKLDLREMSLGVVTHESTETMKKREAAVDDESNLIRWDSDQLFLPVYGRYQSQVVFEFGRSGLGQLVGRGKPDAIAVLWLQDLTDNLEAEIELPVVVGPDMHVLRQQVINDQTREHHPFEIVGTVWANIAFSAGLDLEHDRLRLAQSRRHAMEAYMAVEGDSEIARRQQSFMDDGVIDRDEKREMNKAHRRALESRGRGMAQVGAYRSVKWMGRGLYDRLPGRKKTREPTVQTEA